MIPVVDRDRLRIPTNCHEPYRNIVPACSGCNGFRNRFEVTCLEPRASLRESDFFKLRDRVFQEKKGLKEKARNNEKDFYYDHLKGVPVPHVAYARS